MEIVAIKHLDCCLEGSLIKEFAFDEAITKDFIQSFADKGKLEYNSGSSKPSFRFEIADELNLKGVEGQNTLRIWFKNAFVLREFYAILKSIQMEVSHHSISLSPN